MCFEMTITLKDESGEKSYKQKFLVYDPVILNHPEDDNLCLKPYIEDAIKNFGEKPDVVKIRINLEL